jgi:hypothetical protein
VKNMRYAGFVCVGLREDEGQIEGIPSGSGNDAVLSFKTAHVECGRLLCGSGRCLKSGVSVSK